MSSNVFPIDIVLPWVNQNDPVWLEKYRKYKVARYGDDSAIRFRDYGTLKYVFRSIEKYAPWVNHVFLITDHQTPDWINREYNKVVLINHDEYIESQYLPTFDSNLIELNLPNIKLLSEHFICFNDDTFLNKPVQPSDFFDKNGQPRDTLAFNAIMPMSIFDHTHVNNLRIINHRYHKMESVRRLLPKLFNIRNGRWNLFSLLLLPWPRFTRFYDPHTPLSFVKSTYMQIISQYPELISETGADHFRSERDFSNWVIRYAQMLNGSFSPRYHKFGVQYQLTQINEAINDISRSKHHVLNINDSEEISELQFKEVVGQLNRAFIAKFPQKSDFEA